VNTWMLLIALCLVLACDRRLDPWVPASEEPPRPEQPVRIPGLEKPEPSARALAPATMGRSAGSPSVAGLELRGTVSLADGSSGGGEGVLFVIARSADGGPPLAVKRLPVGPFPLEFKLGPGDVMMKGRAFEGPLTLAARVDRDGNPLTRGEDDLTGAVQGTVRPGAAGIEIRLSPASGG